MKRFLSKKLDIYASYVSIFMVCMIMLFSHTVTASASTGDSQKKVCISSGCLLKNKIAKDLTQGFDKQIDDGGFTIETDSSTEEQSSIGITILQSVKVPQRQDFVIEKGEIKIDSHPVQPIIQKLTEPRPTGS